MLYKVILSKPYTRALKKLRRSGNFDESAVNVAVNILASGGFLAPRYRDHQLKGIFHEYRECHIKGDFLLVYQIRDNELVLILGDIGTHSHLGL